MIEMLVNSAANRIGNNLGADADMKAVYRYGLHILVLLFINMIIVLSLSAAFDILDTTLFFLVSFLPFRGIGGGVHLKTYQRCLVVGSALMLGSSYLASVISAWLPILIVWLGSIILTTAAIYYWVPTSNINLNVRQKTQLMIMITVIWFSLTIYLWTARQWHYLLALSLGAVVSELLISPIGFKLMANIDNYFDNKGGEINV